MRQITKYPLAIQLILFVMQPTKQLELYNTLSNSVSLPQVTQQNQGFIRKFTQKLRAFNPRKTIRNFYDIFRLWTIQYTLAITLGFILMTVLTLTNYTENIAINELLQNQNINFFLIFIYAVLIGPTIEELAFRLSLRFSHLNLTITMSFITLLIFKVIITNCTFLGSYLPFELFTISSWQGIVSIILLVLGTPITLYIVISRTIPKQAGHTFFNKHVGLFYYTSTLLFGLAHITNYPNLGLLLILTPLIVSPQLLIGFSLGFIRIRYGMSWAIFTHMFHNFITLAPLAILVSMGGQTILTDPTMLTNKTENVQIILAVSVTGVYILFVILAIFASLIQLFCETVVYLTQRNKTMHVKHF